MGVGVGVRPTPGQAQMRVGDCLSGQAQAGVHTRWSWGSRALLLSHPASKPALPRGGGKWPSARLPTAAWPAGLGHAAPSLQG